MPSALSTRSRRAGTVTMRRAIQEGRALPHEERDGAAARRVRLRTLLREKAITFGDFVLASGRRSAYYLDGRLVTLDAEGSWLIARAILDLIAAKRIDAAAIGGLTLGADPIAGATAAVSFQEG